VTYRSLQAPFEISVGLINVGDVYDVVGGGVGRLEHGGYTVIDVSGAYYLDPDRRHRLGARIENALDEEYATGLIRARYDLDDSSYAARFLGPPRTLHLTYSYSW
jgi:vitamin B12 transporter